MNKLTIILFLISASCQFNKEHTKHESENVNREPNEITKEVITLECEYNDTIIAIDDFQYELRKVNTRDYEIYWGNINEKRKYSKSFECWKTSDDICDFTPKVDTITEDGVILRVMTETPSTGNCSPIEYKMIYLPRDKTQTPFEIEYYLKFENNYIVYSNSYDTISVMNLKTKKNQSFELNPKPYFEFKTIDNSLDSIHVVNKKLMFKYLIGNHEDYGYTKREMKLKI